MDNTWKILNDRIKSCEDTVLATIIAAKGSVPRGIGARMLVAQEGRIYGTVGGGAVEYESINIAKEMLTNKCNGCRHYILDKNDVADIGMVCGGDVDILFQFIPGNDSEVPSFYKSLYESVVLNKACHLLYTLKDDKIGMTLAYSDGTILGEPVDDEILSQLGRGAGVIEKETKYYVDRIVNNEKVYIFGGGHVAQQLVPILYRCDFACVVLEDRKEYADASLFERKCDIILVEEGALSENLPKITENDYVCIMTRGHKDDYLIQKAVLKSKAHYIGVIGSRRKIAAVNEKLLADGFSKTDIDRITTPIGIDILSSTPAEIAVSITAQLIMVRALKNGGKK